MSLMFLWAIECFNMTLGCHFNYLAMCILVSLLAHNVDSLDSIYVLDHKTG
jgi:hypothetical protein